MLALQLFHLYPFDQDNARTKSRGKSKHYVGASVGCGVEGGVGDLLGSIIR